MAFVFCWGVDMRLSNGVKICPVMLITFLCDSQTQKPEGFTLLCFRSRIDFLLYRKIDSAVSFFLSVHSFSEHV